MSQPRIAITMGDAAGVGPEIIMKSLGHRDLYDRCRPIVIGDATIIGGNTFCANLEFRWQQTLGLSLQWISEEDVCFYYLAPNPDDAVLHILKFYSRYHSSRYVKDTLIIRMLTPLTEEQIDLLNTRFASIVAEGKMSLSPPLPEETDHLELPRLIFTHTRNKFGRLRQLIDAINEF